MCSPSRGAGARVERASGGERGGAAGDAERADAGLLDVVEHRVGSLQRQSSSTSWRERLVRPPADAVAFEHLAHLGEGALRAPRRDEARRRRRGRGSGHPRRGSRAPSARLDRGQVWLDLGRARRATATACRLIATTITRRPSAVGEVAAERAVHVVADRRPALAGAPAPARRSRGWRPSRTPTSASEIVTSAARSRCGSGSRSAASRLVAAVRPVAMSHAGRTWLVGSSPTRRAGRVGEPGRRVDGVVDGGRCRRGCR